MMQPSNIPYGLLMTQIIETPRDVEILQFYLNLV